LVSLEDCAATVFLPLCNPPRDFPGQVTMPALFSPFSSISYFVFSPPYWTASGLPWFPLFLPFFFGRPIFLIDLPSLLSFWFFPSTSCFGSPLFFLNFPPRGLVFPSQCHGFVVGCPCSWPRCFFGFFCPFGPSSGSSPPCWYLLRRATTRWRRDVCFFPSFMLRRHFITFP